MTGEEQRRRMILTLVSAVFVFVIIVITSIITIILVNIMVSVDIIAEVGGRVKVTPILLITSLISLVVAVIVTAVTSRIPLKPVNSFLDQMDQLASGDFSVRVQVEEHPFVNSALGKIYESFNKMAQELENTAVLRNDFINHFSHEFKTPIVSIAGFAKLLRRGDLSEQQREEYLTVIEEEALRLSDMATNVLQLTKVENQTILTDVTVYNLSEQIRSCVVLLEDKWNQKKLSFSMEMGEHAVKASEELLKQVWINLIHNAVKFAPENTQIRIVTEDGAEQVSVSVLNEGEMITPEKQKKIFNKFYQVDESHSTEGNGIGLAIAKRVVELHKGTINVRCEEPYVIFTVELPK